MQKLFRNCLQKTIATNLTSSGNIVFHVLTLSFVQLNIQHIRFLMKDHLYGVVLLISVQPKKTMQKNGQSATSNVWKSIL